MPAVLMLVLAGCGGSGGRVATSDQIETNVPLDTGVGLDKSEPWDLVLFADSFGQWIAQDWADLIEADLGVEVRVHDHFMGGLPIDLIPQMLSDLENLRREVGEAEIIVVYGNPMNTAPPDAYMCTGSPATIDPDPPEFYTSADYAPYGDAFRDVFDEIFELRAGEPTVIRAFDQFAGRLVDWREADIEAECTAAWEAAAGAIREAADEYGVVTASFYDAFNGPDHDEDPREKGYVAGDGYHHSREGALAMAEILHSLGYGAVIP
jgi:hypothetical protein